MSFVAGWDGMHAEYHEKKQSAIVRWFAANDSSHTELKLSGTPCADERQTTTLRTLIAIARMF
jgi:hypothetical protein